MTAPILNDAFRYSDSVKTKRPGYLHRKWNRLYPGWNKPPKPRPVIQFRKRETA